MPTWCSGRLKEDKGVLCSAKLPMFATWGGTLVAFVKWGAGRPEQAACSATPTFRALSNSAGAGREPGIQYLERAASLGTSPKIRSDKPSLALNRTSSERPNLHSLLGAVHSPVELVLLLCLPNQTSSPENAWRKLSSVCEVRHPRCRNLWLCRGEPQASGFVQPRGTAADGAAPPPPQTCSF